MKTGCWCYVCCCFCTYPFPTLPPLTLHLSRPNLRQMRCQTHTLPYPAVSSYHQSHFHPRAHAHSPALGFEQNKGRSLRYVKPPPQPPPTQPRRRGLEEEAAKILQKTVVVPVPEVCVCRAYKISSLHVFRILFVKRERGR